MGGKATGRCRSPLGALTAERTRASSLSPPWSPRVTHSPRAPSPWRGCACDVYQREINHLAEPAPAPDIPIKHSTLTLVASSRPGITSSVFPRQTETTGRAAGDRHPTSLPRAGLIITAGTRFNQEQRRALWGREAVSLPRDTHSSPPGEADSLGPAKGSPVFMPLPSTSRAATTQPELRSPRKTAGRDPGRPRAGLTELSLRRARPLSPDRTALAPP